MLARRPYNASLRERYSIALYQVNASLRNHISCPPLTMVSHVPSHHRHQHRRQLLNHLVHHNHAHQHQQLVTPTTTYDEPVVAETLEAEAL